MAMTFIQNIVGDHIGQMVERSHGRDDPHVHESYCSAPFETCSCRAPKRLFGNIHPRKDLFKGDLLDSFSMLEVLCFVEKEFGIKVPDGEATMENFRTIEGIADLVERCLTMKHESKGLTVQHQVKNEVKRDWV